MPIFLTPCWTHAQPLDLAPKKNKNKTCELPVLFWDWRVVLAVLLLNFYAVSVALRCFQPASSPVLRYYDLASAWWTINYTHRAEAFSLQSYLSIRLIQEHDLSLVMGACVSALSSPGVRDFFAHSVFASVPLRLRN